MNYGDIKLQQVENNDVERFTAQEKMQQLIQRKAQNIPTIPKSMV